MPRKNQYVFKKKFESFTLSLDVRVLGSISKHKNGIPIEHLVNRLGESILIFCEDVYIFL